jgi:hypothetical protein
MPVEPRYEDILVKIGQWLCHPGKCAYISNSWIGRVVTAPMPRKYFISGPNHQTLPATGTQLLRSSNSESALSIATRLGEYEGLV